MAAIPFDTLALSDALEKSGFSTEQAKGAAHALSAAISEQTAPKSDIDRLEIHLKSIEAQLAILKWAAGITIAGVAALVVRGFF